MNIRKNAEAVFLAATVLCTFAAYATAEVPHERAVTAIQVASSATAVQATSQDMQVVVIQGKRLTEAEKAALN